jgi:hypothetical protein
MKFTVAISAICLASATAFAPAANVARVSQMDNDDVVSSISCIVLHHSPLLPMHYNMYCTNLMLIQYSFIHIHSPPLSLAVIPLMAHLSNILEEVIPITPTTSSSPMPSQKQTPNAARQQKQQISVSALQRSVVKNVRRKLIT